MLIGWVVVWLSFQIQVDVWGFPVHSVPQGASWSSVHDNVQEGKVAVWLSLHGKLDIGTVKDPDHECVILIMEKICGLVVWSRLSPCSQKSFGNCRYRGYLVEWDDKTGNLNGQGRKQLQCAVPELGNTTKNFRLDNDLPEIRAESHPNTSLTLFSALANMFKHMLWWTA